MENPQEDRKLERLKSYMEKCKRKRDYEGLFAFTQFIIFDRKNALKEKVDYYMKESKQYSNQETPSSERDSNIISFIHQQFNIASERYNACSKLENELIKKNIGELIIEAENQYHEYLRENYS